MVWTSLEILRAQFDIIITSHTFFIILSDKIGLNFVVIWHRMWQSRSRAFCETKNKQSLWCLLSYKVYTKINKSSSSSRSFPFPVVGLWLKPIILLTVFFFWFLTYFFAQTDFKAVHESFSIFTSEKSKTQNEIIWVLLKCKLNKLQKSCWMTHIIMLLSKNKRQLTLPTERIVNK